MTLMQLQERLRILRFESLLRSEINDIELDANCSSRRLTKH